MDEHAGEIILQEAITTDSIYNFPFFTRKVRSILVSDRHLYKNLVPSCQPLENLLEARPEVRLKLKRAYAAERIFRSVNSSLTTALSLMSDDPEIAKEILLISDTDTYLKKDLKDYQNQIYAIEQLLLNPTLDSPQTILSRFESLNKTISEIDIETILSYAALQIAEFSNENQSKKNEYIQRAHRFAAICQIRTVGTYEDPENSISLISRLTSVSDCMRDIALYFENPELFTTLNAALIRKTGIDIENRYQTDFLTLLLNDALQKSCVLEKSGNVQIAANCKPVSSVFRDAFSNNALGFNQMIDGEIDRALSALSDLGLRARLFCDNGMSFNKVVNRITHKQNHTVLRLFAQTLLGFGLAPFTDLKKALAHNKKTVLISMYPENKKVSATSAAVSSNPAEQIKKILKPLLKNNTICYAGVHTQTHFSFESEGADGKKRSRLIPIELLVQLGQKELRALYRWGRFIRSLIGEGNTTPTYPLTTEERKLLFDAALNELSLL